MLAGRKLLLADDSITIQKVVALTFADEGIEVFAVGNGAEAIEKLEEFRPDVVLADVYMPEKTGLQVCDYIKRNDRLKHIPVMLLVGSFEPYDEAEARRVGADDTLTKPFQSIRTLVEKVGVLLGREAPQDDPEQLSSNSEAEPVAATPVAVVPDDASPLDGASTLDGAETLEFPDLDAVPRAGMDTGELEIATADTREMSTEIPPAEQPLSFAERESALKVEEEQMETHRISDTGPELSEGFGDDTLLDLSPFEVAPPTSPDDAILDIEYEPPAPEMFYATAPDNSLAAVAVTSAPESPAVAGEAELLEAEAEEVVEWEGEIHISEPEWGLVTPVSEVAPDLAVSEASVSDAPVVAELHSSAAVAASAWAPAPAAAESETHAGQVTLAQLSPETIDAIARRVVEQLSEKAVQEITWEVVPQLAELLIKQRLEELK